jgi:homoserine dehydrogenase
VGDLIDSVKHKITVFSQSWDSAEDDSFVAGIDSFKAKWYVRDDKKSFITADQLTMAEAEKLGAAAIPVLE